MDRTLKDCMTMDAATAAFYVIVLVAFIQIDRRLYDIIKTMKVIIQQRDR